MLTVDINRVAAQANGAAFIKYGETTALSSCTASEKPRDGIDFSPLSVEYEEKLYSVGKIPGGFNKREGKASENAVLTSCLLYTSVDGYKQRYKHNIKFQLGNMNLSDCLLYTSRCV